MKIELTPLKVILTGLCVTAILVPIWLYLLFSASPSQTEDYVALYNASNKPENYDESQNAWPIYEQAIAAAVKIPSEIYEFVLPKELPTLEQKTEIEKFVTANRQTLELLRQAAEKPYCYKERIIDEGKLLWTGFDELGSSREMARVLSISCLYNISEGNIDRAIMDISVCEKISRFLRRESLTVIEQLFGIGIGRLWQHSAFFLVAKAELSDSQKESFGQIIDNAIEDKYVICLDGEKYAFCDFVQSVFVGSKSGNGRLAWSRRWYNLDFTGNKPDYESLNVWIREWKCFLRCAFGSTQNDVLEDFDKYLTLNKKISFMTPWQREQDTSGTVKMIEDIDKRISNACLEVYLGGFNVYNYSYREKATFIALQTVLAIKEFQVTHNRLPQALAELVEKQYLKEVPLDPFSDGELVYKVDGDSYFLYSKGYNFKDDNCNWGCDDIIFWPAGLEDQEEEMEIGL